MRDVSLLLQALDGGVFEHVKDYLVALCRTELETFTATHNTYQFLLDKSTRVSPTSPPVSNTTSLLLTLDFFSYEENSVQYIDVHLALNACQLFSTSSRKRKNFRQDLAALMWLAM